MIAPPAHVQECVHAYLEACEQGDVVRAQSFLGDGVRLTFPGSQVYTELGEWLTGFRARFEWLRKQDHLYEGHPRSEGGWVLLCRGTLSGRTRHGREFSGIRFLDRFEVVDGRIVDQQVWNDIAHHGLLAPDHSTSKEG